MNHLSFADGQGHGRRQGWKVGGQGEEAWAGRRGWAREGPKEGRKCSGSVQHQTGRWQPPCSCRPRLQAPRDRSNQCLSLYLYLEIQAAVAAPGIMLMNLNPRGEGVGVVELDWSLRLLLYIYQRHSSVHVSCISNRNHLRLEDLDTFLYSSTILVCTSILLAIHDSFSGSLYRLTLVFLAPQCTWFHLWGLFLWAIFYVLLLCDCVLQRCYAGDWNL